MTIVLTSDFQTMLQNSLISVKNHYIESIKYTIKKSKINSKNILIIEAADWSDHPLLKAMIGNFRLRPFSSQIQKIGKTHCIHYFIAHSEKQLDKALQKLRDRQMDCIWILGYGYPKGIFLNKNFYLNENSEDLMKSLAQKIQKPSTIILSSCSTGMGDTNIAKTLSLFCENAKVHAPQNDINETLINQQMAPRFQKNSNEVPIRTYYNGKEL